MPANEQTWRDSKLLHLVFGISGLAMLVTTVWMLAADHRREWKDYMRKFRDVETWMADARLTQQQTADYEHDVKEAVEQLEASRRQVPDATLVNQFDEEVDRDAEKRKEKVDLKPLNSAYEELRNDARGAAAAPADKIPRAGARRWSIGRDSAKTTWLRSRSSRTPTSTCSAASTTWASAPRCPRPSSKESKNGQRGHWARPGCR